MDETLDIGPLRGGGLALGYRCTSRCRHCLYRGGPKRRDGEAASEAELEALLDQLAEHGPGARYHIGGGEPFLDRDRLELVVAGMERRGLDLEYVETNASWVRDQQHAEQVLSELAQAGLSCVLVSLSPFHAEFIPLSKPLALAKAAERTLTQGAFVWVPEFLRDLQPFDPDARLDLDALLAGRGEAYARQLASRYMLVPGGRTGDYLYDHGQRLPWREVASEGSCHQRLTDTSHFHVDGQGSYVPGLCAGLALPFEKVPGAIPLKDYPVLGALVRGGPTELVALAAEHGFEPAPTYSSACHLCDHTRRFLYERTEHHFAELGPPGYYAD